VTPLLDFLPVFLFLGLVTPVKPLHPSRSVQHPPLSGEKRVALAAQLHLKLFPGGTGGKRAAAGTNYLGVIIIFGMYLFFHRFQPE
jgi:hypothetical protein